MTEPITRTIQLNPDLPLTITEMGGGRTALILHGGGGPFTVQGIAAHLSNTMRVIMPTHPGWNGTERPAWFASVNHLAVAYLRLLQAEGAHDVLVVGSSMGGWIASEMAARDSGALISDLVLIDGVGVEVAGQPIVNFYALDARGVAEHSYHDPDRFYVDPATVPPERAAIQRANMATMRVLAGETMYDPTLLSRLGHVQIPTLVLWGDSDRIVTPAYGRAFASAFPTRSSPSSPTPGISPTSNSPTQPSPRSTPSPNRDRSGSRSNSSLTPASSHSVWEEEIRELGVNVLFLPVSSGMREDVCVVRRRLVYTVWGT